MDVTIGDIVASEFGQGKLVAVTKKWIIHEIDNGKDQAAVYRENDDIWIPTKLNFKTGD